MSDWNSVWQGIGQLGQTKKGMYTPMIDAYRNKGKVWSEGLGRISDTLGGIADKQFAKGERVAGQEHQIAMQSSEQLWEGTQRKLDRSLEEKKLAMTWDMNEADIKQRNAQAKLSREMEQTLLTQKLAYDKYALNRQLSEQEEAQLRELNQEYNFWQDKKLQFDRQMTEEERAALEGEALGERGLDIQEKEADNRGLLLTAQLAEFGSGQDAAWRAGIANLKEIFPDVFEGVDLNTGYGMINSLDTIRQNDPEKYATIDKHFRQWVSSTNPKYNKELTDLWGTVTGGSATSRGDGGMSNMEAMRDYIKFTLQVPDKSVAGSAAGFTYNYPPVDPEAKYISTISLLSDAAATIEQLRSLGRASALIAKENTTRSETATVENILRDIAQTLGIEIDY